MAQLYKVLKSLWEFLREASGENDYRRYRARALVEGDWPMTPAKFYIGQLQRKYSRPSRCC